MSKTGPIVLVDDDHDDKEIFELAIKELEVNNPLIYFDSCDKAMEYLLTTKQQPFVIFCDVNLPVCTGIEFKKQIDSNEKLRKKSIPFVFYSTSIDQATVNQAYLEMTIQGYFQKVPQLEEIKNTIKMVLGYWMVCRHPNST